MCLPATRPRASSRQRGTHTSERSAFSAPFRQRRTQKKAPQVENRNRGEDVHVRYRRIPQPPKSWADGTTLTAPKHAIGIKAAMKRSCTRRRSLQTHLDQRAFALKNATAKRHAVHASDPCHAVNAWFNDFELSVGRSIFRASVEKKRSWDSGGGARDHPEGSEGGARAGEHLKLKRKIPQVALERYAPSRSCKPGQVGGGERKRGGGLNRCTPGRIIKKTCAGRALSVEMKLKRS
jgi:hypothetical protein